MAYKPFQDWQRRESPPPPEDEEKWRKFLTWISSLNLAQFFTERERVDFERGKQRQVEMRPATGQEKPAEYAPYQPDITGEFPSDVYGWLSKIPGYAHPYQTGVAAPITKGILEKWPAPKPTTIDPEKLRADYPKLYRGMTDEQIIKSFSGGLYGLPSQEKLENIRQMVAGEVPYLPMWVMPIGKGGKVSKETLEQIAKFAEAQLAKGTSAETVIKGISRTIPEIEVRKIVESVAAKLGKVAEKIPEVVPKVLEAPMRPPGEAQVGLKVGEVAKGVGGEIPPIKPPPPPTAIAPTPPVKLPDIPMAGEILPLPPTSNVMRDILDKTPSKLPGFIKGIIGRITKTPIVADDIIGGTKILEGRLKDIADEFATIATTDLNYLVKSGAKPPAVKGVVTTKGILPLEGAPKLGTGEPSMHLHDIVENMAKYDIPEKFHPYFEKLRSLSRQTTQMLESELGKYGIRLRKLAGEADWVYLRRVVDEIGGVEARGFASWRGTQKPRVFTTAGAGEVAKKSVTYLDPERELYYQLQSAYNWIISLRTKVLLNTMTTTAKARVPARIVEDLVRANSQRIAAAKLAGTGGWSSEIMRAARGEDLPPQTLAAIRTHFPDVAERLGVLMAKKAKYGEYLALKKEFSEVFTSAIESFWKAKGVYNRALQQAGPTFEEGICWYLGPKRIVTTQELAGKKVLGIDLARQIEEVFGFRKPGILEKVIKGTGWAGGILRQTKASLDLSVQGIQTLPVLGIDFMNLIKFRPTAAWIRGAVGGWRSFFNPKSAIAWANKPEIKAIQAEMAIHGGLPVSVSEFAVATETLAKVPIAGHFYKRSGDAFTVGRQISQTYLYMGERARALKGLTGEAEILKRLGELAKWSNLSTGAFSLRGAGITPLQAAAENTLFFSTRLNRSVFSLVMGMAKGGYTGKMCRDSIAGLLAATYAFFTFFPLALGQKPRLNPLPESMGGDGAKWLSIKVGPVYISVGGTIHMLTRLVASNWAEIMEGTPENLVKISMDNPNIRFIRGKFGAPAALVTDFMTGHDYLGELTRDNFGSIAKTFGEWGIPIWAGGTADAIEAGATPFEAGTAGVAEFLGGRTVPETDWDKVRNLRQIYAEMDFGKKYDDLNAGQRGELLRKHKDLAELEEKSKAHWVETGTEFEQWFYNERKVRVEDRNTRLNKAAAAVVAGDMSKRDYDGERKYIRPYYSGAMAVLYSAKQSLNKDAQKRIEKWITENQKPEDAAVNAYQEYYSQLIDQAELPKDWELLEEKLNEFLKRYNPEVRVYILEQRNANIQNLPEPARSLELMRLEGIEDGTWWDNYREEGGLYQTAIPSMVPEQKTRLPMPDYFPRTQTTPTAPGAPKRKLPTLGK